MREKLIGLIEQADDKCRNTNCKVCDYRGEGLSCGSHLIADYLIKNGVVIAEEVVSKELYEQIKWERDTALNQLERVGLSLGEKTDDVVKVVRCEQCDWYREEDGGICVNSKCSKSYYGCRVPKQHFCSYGEPKEGEE